MPRFAVSALFALALFILAPTHPAISQGCSQCRQTIGQTPPQTQTAYRRAIAVMVLSGTCVFAAALVTLKRFRQP